MQETVLVVDDNPVNIALMDRLLRHRAMNVITANNGPAALEAVDLHHPDLILVDVQMPGMDGIALTRHLKTNPSTRMVPIMLVTAYIDADDRERGIEAGADDVVSKPINPGELWARLQTLLKLRQSNAALATAEATLLDLARRIEARNPFGNGHCDRLAMGCQALGAALRLDPADLVGLRQAAVVHDVGKLVVPEEILLKPGPLTAAETACMRQHPVVGESICAPLKGWASALPMIRHHHEKMDGSGYPDGLRGEAIPHAARLFAVVEVYDVLTHAAPYRTAMTRARACEILDSEVARGWWDEAIWSAYKTLL